MTRKELTVDIKKRVAAGESKRAIFSRYSMTEWEDAASRILPLRSFAYSPAGDLLATHTYTNSTDILTETYTDGTTITYTYTPDNLPLRTTYASGKWTENVYDNQRRLVGTISSDSLNNATYALDEFGRTTSSANSVASIAYSISDTDKATNEFWTVGTNTLAITRSFGSQDRLANLALPSVGYALNYTYATDGRLAAVSNNDAVITYAYTPDHLDAGYSLTLSNGAVFTRSLLRDEYRRSLVTGISSAANGVGVGSLAYTYDALNRPTTRNNDTFGYNARSEVTAANVSGVFSAYGYDEIGNSTNWAVTCLNQYTEFTHDADGNMTQCGDWTYTYDAANRLKTVPSNGVLLATNLYDAKSRRVKKVTPEATTTFFYDGWNLVEERIAYTNGTSSTIHYFWGKDLSGTLQGAGGVGGLLYLTIDGVPFIPCYDNIGNIIRYLDANGNTVAQYIYDAFGNLISKSGPLADIFRYRFSTRYFDSETGLYYYGYRFYHPRLMRWLNRDPIEEDGGLNLYCFVENSPLQFYDAFGQRRANLPGIVLDRWCEDVYNHAMDVMRTAEERRAWNRYTKHGWRGRNDDIELSATEVKNIAESITAVVSYVQEKRSSCKKGMSFAISTSIGGDAPPPWRLALGGVSVGVTTSCNDGCFSYEYRINDLYDFDVKGVPGFTSRTIKGEFYTILVRSAEFCLQCDWQTFYHKGTYIGK